jgi:hypothetical protein
MENKAPGETGRGPEMKIRRLTEEEAAWLGCPPSPWIHELLFG